MTEMTGSANNAMDSSNFIGLAASGHAESRRGTPAATTTASVLAKAAGPPLTDPPWRGDPTIAALLRLVSAPPADADTPDGDLPDDVAVRSVADEVDELTDRLDESVRDIRRLGAQLERADRELRQLRVRSQRLAGALGACGSCWGEVPGCPECLGSGRPGRVMPDEKLFAELVLPVVRLVRRFDLASPGSRSGPAAP